MAKKEYNVDLDIKGKVSATTVPNSTGSIVTWNSSTKVFGLRTNAEIIADLNLSSNFVPYTGATANVNLGSRSITSTGGFIGNASTATKLANIITTFTGTYPVTVNVNGTIYSHTGLTYTGSTGALSANTFIGVLSGNATTATTLATARTINGTSFNGSTNITTANWGAARNITIGNTTKSVDGSANVSWSLTEIGINTGDLVPYTGANKAVDLNTQKLTIGGDFEKRNVSFEKSYLNNTVSSSTHFTRLTDVASFSRGNDSTTTSDCIVITLPIRSSTCWVMEVDIFSPVTSSIFSGAPTKLLISAYSISNRVRSVTAISSADNVKSVSFCRDIDNNTIIIIRSNSSSNFNYGKVNITNFYHGVSYSSDLAVKTNYKVDAVVESSLTDLTTNGTITNEQFTRDSYLWNKGNFSQADLDNWNVAFNRGDFRDFGLGNSSAVSKSILTSPYENGLYGIRTSSTDSPFPSSSGSVLHMKSSATGDTYWSQLALLGNAQTTPRAFISHGNGTNRLANWVELATVDMVNSTYKAGNGLTLSGTTFGQTITTSGTGSFVTGITQTANGFQVNLGTPPNTVYSTDTLAILNAGTSTSGALQTAKNLNDWLNGKGFSTQTLSAGSGVSIVGSVISNSAPNIDQKLSISGMKITLDRSGGTVTVPSSNLVTSTSATGLTNVATTNTNTYLNIVEGGTTLGSSTQVTGTGAVSVSSDAAGKLTINGVDTTYNTFTKTTSGLVPAPTGTTSTRFLREDGSWVTPTDSTYSAGTLALLQEGTNTTNRVWSSKILTDFTDGKYLQLSGGTITGDLGIGITPTAKLDVNGTVRFRNFSNTLLSTDSNGNLSNVTNLILESDVLRPSTASGISLGNSDTPFKNLHLVGSGYFTGNMLFGQNDTPTAMKTAIMWNGEIRANNHLKFLSDGEVLFDKDHRGFMYLRVNDLDIGHDDYEQLKLYSKFGQIGIYDDMLEIQHHVISVNASSGYNVSVDDGKLRWYQKSSGQLVNSVIELHGNSLYTTSNANLGSSSNRWGKLWGTNVDFNGNMVVGKINNIKLNGRGSLGSPTNSLTGNNLTNYVLGDVSNKDALATFRFESVITTNNEAVFAQYGASLLVQSNDTMFTLSANPFGPEIYVSGGTSNMNVRWNKKLAFSDNNFTITATAFYESSLKKFKTNINEFKDSGLELINSLDIVTFDRIDDKTKNKIGVIADDTPEEFLNEDQTAVDLYKTIFIQAKAIQELEKKNKSLEDRLSRLEKLVNKLTSD